jgi:hypothetical protein
VGETTGEKETKNGKKQTTEGGGTEIEVRLQAGYGEKGAPIVVLQTKD